MKKGKTFVSVVLGGLEMNIRFNSLSKLTGNASRGFKKTAIALTAFTTLTLGIGAQAFAELGLKTVYYVYVDNTYVGMVSDKALIEGVVEKKLESSEKDLNKELKLTVGPNLTYIPEQVFESVSKTDDKKVVEKVDELLSIEAEATAISLDDKHSVYVKDVETAEQVIEEIKLKFITREQLEHIEKQKSEVTNSLPPLKENETRLVDVRLSKDVALVDTKVKPTEILTATDAVQYLLKGTLEERKYKVKQGDVLGQIANNHDMSLKQLLTLNPGLKEDSVLKIDQELNVTIYEPLVEVLVDKEVFRKEAIPYSKEVIEDSSMYKGDSKVKQEGRNGAKEVTYKITEKNGAAVDKVPLVETITEEPTSHIVIKGTKVIPSRGDGIFAWPAVGGYISSKQGQRWGKLHKGIDIARPSDRTIKAADNGKIKFAGWSGGYGNKVVIDHQNGYETVYAHLSSITVSVGQSVSQGMKIGVMGSTGNSTGVHLHFEIYKNGSLENPLKYIR